MNKLTVFIYLFTTINSFYKDPGDKYITDNGLVSFFSYTNAVHIEAENNKVYSTIDLSKNEIIISMPMDNFVFKNRLMCQHFNKSYIESDLYPKATFKGTISSFDITNNGYNFQIIKGKLTLREVTKEIEIKTKIERIEGTYILTGKFDLRISDFEINIPPLLAHNIAKTISVKFRFEYQPYET